MKKIQHIILAMLVMFAVSACQDKDYDIAAPVLSPLDAEQITGQMIGDDYIWSWGNPDNYSMQVSRYENGTFVGTETVEGNSYTHKNVDTNIEYTYIFKLSDGTNVSLGTIKKFTREGASKMSGITMAQIEKAGGYDARVEWAANESAESVAFTATNGSRTINEDLDGGATEYTITDVNFGDEWTVTLIAKNSKGASLPVSSSLKIGKTAIGFLSIYPTPEALVADGDDDEASAWLWLHEEYPTAQYVYFGDITSCFSGCATSKV